MASGVSIISLSHDCFLLSLVGSAAQTVSVVSTITSCMLLSTLPTAVNMSWLTGVSKVFCCQYSLLLSAQALYCYTISCCQPSSLLSALGLLSTLALTVNTGSCCHECILLSGWFVTTGYCCQLWLLLSAVAPVITSVSRCQHWLLPAKSRSCYKYRLLLSTLARAFQQRGATAIRLSLAVSTGSYCQL